MFEILSYFPIDLDLGAVLWQDYPLMNRELIVELLTLNKLGVLSKDDKFDHTQIPLRYKAKAGERSQWPIYYLKDHIGSDAAEVLFPYDNRIDLIIDNFPAQRKGYTAEWPIRTFKDFEYMMEMANFKLLPNER